MDNENVGLYYLAESIDGECNLFSLNLQQLIFEKMVLLFEKMQPALNELQSSKNKLDNVKGKLLLKTDFKKELGTSRPTKDMKEAYIKPLLVEREEKLNDAQRKVDFYKNKIIIVNDLIKHKRLLLQAEAGLKE